MSMWYSPTKPWRGLGLLAGLGLALAGGCGDGPICPSDVVVLFLSPMNGANVFEDEDPASPGIQTTITVRSNLKEGDEFELVITDTGGATQPYQSIADASGEGTFAGITLPPGQIELKLTGTSGRGCGTASDNATITVIGDAVCSLHIKEGLISRSRLGHVLNSTNDADPGTPDFQGNAVIATVPGFAVELILSGLPDESKGKMTSGGDGKVTFPITLTQRQKALRARCSSPTGNYTTDSGTLLVYIDTEVPACTLEPAAGTTITHLMDSDGNLANGTQIALLAHVDAGASNDVAGQLATFSVNGVSQSVAVDLHGNAAIVGTFQGASGSQIPVTFEAADEAGNPCTINQSYSYVTQGCDSIVVTTPAAGTTTTTDVNTSLAGLQTNIVVTVSSDCEGRSVTTDCDLDGEKTAPVSSGTAQFEVTLCSQSQCQGSRSCSATVTNSVGIETSDGVDIAYDTKPPQLEFSIRQPSHVSCGNQYEPSIDYDNNDQNGVQVQVFANVFGEAGATRWLEVTSNGGQPQTVAVPANGLADATLALGSNQIVAFAQDIHGNRSRAPTPSCSITLAQIAVGFAANIADGLTGPVDGSVVGGQLRLDICGTVSVANATMDVTIDPGTAREVTRTVSATGNSWCVNGELLSEGDHVIVASANAGLGSNTLNPLTVDLTPPSDPGNPLAAVSQVNRQRGRFEWTAPDNGGAPAESYTVKVAARDISTPGDFAMFGTELAATGPSAPGSTDSSLADGLRPGTNYYFGVVAHDLGGNTSGVGSAGPLQVDFTSSALGTPTIPSRGFQWRAYGYVVTGGDFNGDAYGDVAVGAPYTDLRDGDGQLWDGIVYVYLGSASGINATSPDLIIYPDPVETQGQFGWALTTIRWNADSIDDLAIGAPFQDGFRGQVTIFHGGADFNVGGQSRPVSLFQNNHGDLHIKSDGTGRLASPRLGYSLAAGRFNGDDSHQDLLVGATLLGTERDGGAVVVFGGATNFGTNSDRIVLSETDASDMGTVVSWIIDFPSEPNDSQFGHRVYNIGRTNGASDTTDDFVIVPPVDQGTAPDKILLFRGRANKPTGSVTDLDFSSTVDLEIRESSTAPTSAFGETVGSIGDLNSDGRRDLLVAAYKDGLGRVFLLDGAAVGIKTVNDLLIATFNAGTGVQEFGSAVVNNISSSGDVDNDGQDDLIIVGTALSPAFDPTIYVWYGGADLEQLIATQGPTLTSDGANHSVASPDAFEHAKTAAWVGDVNNDGLPDLCVADHEFGDQYPPNGWMHVLR